jgi:hypothetical protein
MDPAFEVDLQSLHQFSGALSPPHRTNTLVYAILGVWQASTPIFPRLIWR